MLDPSKIVTHEKYQHIAGMPCSECRQAEAAAERQRHRLGAPRAAKPDRG